MGENGKTSKTRVLIFGQGWLGTELNAYLNKSGFDSKVLGVLIHRQIPVQMTLDAIRPDIVVNAAGRAGAPSRSNGIKNIDWCEESAENRFATWQSNVLGPAILRDECQKRGIYLAHFSSGCIYDDPKHEHTRGFNEYDTPNPRSWYSQTKTQAEQIVLSYVKALIIRPRMPFWGKVYADGQTHPRDLLRKLLSYGEVLAYEPNSISFVPDLLYCAKKLMEGRYTGIFNVTNPGPLTHREILTMYRETVDATHRYKALTLDEFIKNKKTQAMRSNCVLDTNRLAVVGGIALPLAEARIRQAFTELAEHQNAE